MAKALGHNTSAEYKGVTDAYVGHLEQDLWTKRLDEDDPDAGVTPAMGARPFKKRRTDLRMVDFYNQRKALRKTANKIATRLARLLLKGKPSTNG